MTPPAESSRSGPGEVPTTRFLYPVSDFHDEPRAPVPTDLLLPETAREAAEPDMPDVAEPDTQPAPQTEDAKQEPEEHPAVTRFKSCRWHEKQDNAPSYCANRDVLPFAGKNGFKPEAWCPDCKFYKVKRTVKRRNSNDWDDY